MNENDWEKIIGPVREFTEKKGRTWSPKLVGKDTEWELGEKKLFPTTFFGLTLFFNLVDSFTLNSHLQWELCKLLLTDD